MEDAERLAMWRSWLDKDVLPEGWDRNLWDEFFALLYRRDTFNSWAEAHDASPEEARKSARYLRQWILRNHIETQALAIRRIADRTADPRTISFGRLLDDIAEHPQILNVDGEDALADAGHLEDVARNVRRFANKVVAHFDRDHALAQDVNLADMNRAVDYMTELFEKWFPAVTDKGVVVQLPTLPWGTAVRLQRRDISVENPGSMVARVVYPWSARCTRAPRGSREEPGGALGVDRSPVRARGRPMAGRRADRFRV